MNNSNLPIDKVVEEIIEEFEFFEDWEDKYAHIIDMGKKLESMEDSLKVEKTTKTQTALQNSAFFFDFEVGDHLGCPGDPRGPRGSRGPGGPRARALPLRALPHHAGRRGRRAAPKAGSPRVRVPRTRHAPADAKRLR